MRSRARRALLSLAVALVVAPLTARAADADDAAPGAYRAGPPAAWFGEREWRVAALFGPELGIGDASYSAAKLRFDAESTLRALSPRATLGMVFSLSAVHASGDETVEFFIPPFTTMRFDYEWQANVFDLVGAARVTYAFAPKLWAFADGGLGVSYAAAPSVELPDGFDAELASSGVAAVVRLAAGVVYAPRPDVRFGAQLLGFDVRVGDGVGSSMSLLLTASHRL